MIRKKFITAAYPGTFDPITLGHMDIIKRSAIYVDKLFIAVAENSEKKPLFSLEERLELTQIECQSLRKDFSCIFEVLPFSGLLIDFAKSMEATLIIRGLRVMSDFDFEYQMTSINKQLSPRMETFFLMAHEHHNFVSSTAVKEITRCKGDISSFVSPHICERLKLKIFDKL